MPRHEFGWMDPAPLPTARYDTYEPQTYRRISVDDAYIEPLLDRLADIDLYWHSLAVPGKGLAYCGITLIPPSAAPAFMEVIADVPELQELYALLRSAQEKGAFLIHYGI